MRPIWRTPFAAVLCIWMSLVLGMTFAGARLLESVPPGAIVWIVGGVFIAPIPLLLAWGVWAMLREPMTGWLGPSILFAFCGAFVPLARPVFDAGVDVNFLTHRPTYEAIVAEARATGPRDGLDVAGLRDGVRFAYRGQKPGRIDFNWATNEVMVIGVGYEESPCVPGRGRVCADRGRRLDPHYSFYWVDP